MATATVPTSATSDWLTTAKTLADQFATRAAAHDEDDSFVAENYAALRAAKMFSAPVPADLGGGGATYAEHAAIIRTLGRACGSTALAYSMHSHLLQATIWRHRHNATPPAVPQDWRRPPAPIRSSTPRRFTTWRSRARKKPGKFSAVWGAPSESALRIWSTPST